MPYKFGTRQTLTTLDQSELPPEVLKEEFSYIDREDYAPHFAGPFFFKDRIDPNYFDLNEAVIAPANITDEAGPFHGIFDLGGGAFIAMRYLVDENDKVELVYGYQGAL